MTSPEERISKLAQAKVISDTEAEGLLSAVRGTPSLERRGYNPFERWSGEVTSLAGLAVSLAGIAASRLGVRYDGALDLHVGARAVPLATAVLDQCAAYPLTALIFWLAARLVSRHTRLIDVVGVVGVSRIPSVLAAAPLAFLSRTITDPTRPTFALLGLALLASAGLGGQIALLLVGFRTVSGARGARLAGAFVGALVVAELASKMALVAVGR